MYNAFDFERFQTSNLKTGGALRVELRYILLCTLVRTWFLTFKRVLKILFNFVTTVL